MKKSNKNLKVHVIYRSRDEQERRYAAFCKRVQRCV